MATPRDDVGGFDRRRILCDRQDPTKVEGGLRRCRRRPVGGVIGVRGGTPDPSLRTDDFLKMWTSCSCDPDSGRGSNGEWSVLSRVRSVSGPVVVHGTPPLGERQSGSDRLHCRVPARSRRSVRGPTHRDVGGSATGARERVSLTRPGIGRSRSASSKGPRPSSPRPTLCRPVRRRRHLERPAARTAGDESGDALPTSGIFRWSSVPT